MKISLLMPLLSIIIIGQAKQVRPYIPFCKAILNWQSSMEAIINYCTWHQNAGWHQQIANWHVPYKWFIEPCSLKLAIRFQAPLMYLNKGSLYFFDAGLWLTRIHWTNLEQLHKTTLKNNELLFFLKSGTVFFPGNERMNILSWVQKWPMCVSRRKIIFELSWIYLDFSLNCYIDLLS